MARDSPVVPHGVSSLPITYMYKDYTNTVYMQLEKADFEHHGINQLATAGELTKRY
jgi:hypothetical protein